MHFIAKVEQKFTKLATYDQISSKIPMLRWFDQQIWLQQLNFILKYHFTS